MFNRSLLPSLALCLLACTTLAAAAPNWNEILGPSQGKIPEPLPDIIWRTDLQKALAESQQSNRPLFVTLRCLPCKQCSAFDKDVMEGGPLLAPLLSQFITVRLTNAKAIGLRMLPIQGYQDLDISWWGYFLSPQGKIYAIFGGKDEVSDATRISPEALTTTMKRVLDHHYDPRREKWDIDGSAPDLKGEASSITALPGYQAWHRTMGLSSRNRNAFTVTRFLRSFASRPSTPAPSTNCATRRSGRCRKMWGSCS